MAHSPGCPDGRRSAGWSRLLAAAALALAVAATSATAAQSAARGRQQVEGLSASEFARLIRDFSEEGGHFRSDNFISNETSYLHVVDKLRQLGATGGAYVGVGPEQNFSYIAKVRPRIAFIVDIRRQAMIQHLMYKAIFHLAPNRAQFLSLLLSKPLPKEKVPPADVPVNELLTFFNQAPADDKAYATNLAAIRKVLEDFKLPLSEGDQASLEYVYKSFRQDGLEISYRIDGYRGGNFPTLKEIIAETDLNGRQGNFLASAEDYDFVRGLHRRNLIIPIVGDFGGKKALAAVGDYLRKNGLTVTAFYTSNVEQYLFDGGSFGAFAENVKKLPIKDGSLFIRAVAGRFPHPARLPGHRLTTLLQPMTVFLRDFGAGRYQAYYDLVTTNYIAGGIHEDHQPRKESTASVRVEFRLAEKQPKDGLTEAAVQNSNERVYLYRDALITNDDIIAARAVEDEGRGNFNIEIAFTKDGAEKMGRATEQHVGSPLAVLFDGVVITAPVVITRVSDRVIISGSFTRQEAERLADGIRSK